MSENRDFFMARWQAERPVFLKVLRALPAGKLDYRPHERSNPAGDIAWTVTREQRALADLLDDSDVHWELKPRPATLAELIDTFERNAAEVERRLSGAKSDWNGPARFLIGGQPIITARVQDLAWFFFFDTIHHRGQLSSYIRPMGGKVPSIYGPSGDEG